MFFVLNFVQYSFFEERTKEGFCAFLLSKRKVLKETLSPFPSSPRRGSSTAPSRCSNNKVPSEINLLRGADGRFLFFFALANTNTIKTPGERHAARGQSHRRAGVGWASSECEREDKKRFLPIKIY